MGYQSCGHLELRHSIMKYLHNTSCGDPVQIGCGLPTYRGVPYQEGYGGAYQFQRGYGIGGSFGALYRTAIVPAVETVVQKALPIVQEAIPAAKRIGKNAVNKAIKQALVSGITAKTLGKKTAMKKLKSSAKDIAKSTLKEAIREAQNIILSQSGNSHPRKRKGSKSSTQPNKKPRHTIFD